MFAHDAETTQRQLKLQNATKNPFLTYSHYFLYLAMIVCPVQSVSVTFKFPVAAHLFVCFWCHRSSFVDATILI